MKIIPEEIKHSFYQKGVNCDEALLLIKTDMGREVYYCDAYTAVTREGVASLFCTLDLKKERGASLFASSDPQTVLTQQDYVFFPWEEIEGIRVEEQVSVIRLVLRKKNGLDEVLLWASFACRKEVFDFRDAVESFLKDGTVPEKKMPEIPRCPHCGEPFSDPKKRICKKCFGKSSLIRRVIPFFMRYRVQMAMVFLTVLLSGAVSVITPYLNSKVLYDEVLTKGGSLYGQIGVLVLSIAAAAFLGAVVKIFNSFVGAKVSSFVTYDLKRTIFSSFERLSYSFFTSRHTGRLITQINSDAESLYWFFCDGVPYFLTNIVQIVGVIAVMLMTNPLLTLIVVLYLYNNSSKWYLQF